MLNYRRLLKFSAALTFALVAGSLTGCQADKAANASAPCCAEPAAAGVAVAPTAAAKPAEPAKPAAAVIRIKAGVTSNYTDPAGNVWLADKGFLDGETTDRDPDLKIENTKDAAFYRSERYSMTKFSLPLPNGKYTVKLHFCETYEGITSSGERIFSFNVEGKDFKDFDIYAKAGGRQKAYVESVPVEITDGKLDINFTAKVENPEINGIEVVPG